MRKVLKQGEGGSSVVMVLSVIAILTTLGFGALFLAESNSTLTRRDKAATNALHIAEAGVNDYLWHLNHDDDYYLTETHQAQGRDVRGNLRWVNFEDGRYHLEVTPPEEGESVITMEATGEALNPRATKRIRVGIRRKSFLSYLYFTNSELMDGGGEVWWITADVLRGPLHTNGDLRISGRPIFEDFVEIGGQIIEGWNYNPDFRGEPSPGYAEGAPILQLPPGNQALKESAQSRGYYYYGTTTLTLNANGSISVANNDTTGNSTGPRGTVWLPSNGVIYVDGQTLSGRRPTNGDVFISGTLSGRLTVAAKNNIYVTNNLVYRDQTEGSQDMLGLVADYAIYVARDAPYNIEIDAALLALNNSFKVENYTIPPAKGTITLIGALVQKYRGPVGTFNPWTGSRRSGYSKDYRYDQRLQTHQPPYFLEPLNASFEQVSWEEVPP